MNKVHSRASVCACVCILWRRMSCRITAAVIPLDIAHRLYTKNNRVILPNGKFVGRNGRVATVIEIIFSVCDSSTHVITAYTNNFQLQALEKCYFLELYLIFYTSKRSNSKSFLIYAEYDFFLMCDVCVMLLDKYCSTLCTPQQCKAEALTSQPPDHHYKIYLIWKTLPDHKSKINENQDARP